MRVGYRAGAVNRKTEFQCQMRGRSTGYFGTGYYFTTDPDYCAGLNHGERPLYKLTFKDDVNWLYGDLDVHDCLKRLNAYVHNADILEDVEQLLPVARKAADMKFDPDDELFKTIKKEYEVWGQDEGLTWPEWRQHDFNIKHLMEVLKACSLTEMFYDELVKDDPNWDNLTQWEKQYSQYFDYSRLDELRQLKFRTENLLPIHIKCDADFIKQFAIMYQDYPSQHLTDEVDSITTVFLKELGYDGVWPAAECDNTTYGGVIFEKDDIAKIELLAEKAKDYNG